MRRATAPPSMRRLPRTPPVRRRAVLRSTRRPLARAAAVSYPTGGPTRSVRSSASGSAPAWRLRSHSMAAARWRGATSSS